MLRLQTPQARTSFAAQSPPVYICPSRSQFLPPPLCLLFLFSSIKPHGIFPDAYPQNLRKVALELLLLLLLLLSRFSRVRLCNPIDGSPPGFPIPGILQARTLEWVAISFSSA